MSPTWVRRNGRQNHDFTLQLYYGGNMEVRKRFNHAIIKLARKPRVERIGSLANEAVQRDGGYTRLLRECRRE